MSTPISPDAAGRGMAYAAAVIDLYGQKVIGLSMGERMRKELVLKALDEEYMGSERPEGALIHSNSGIRYCSEVLDEVRNTGQSLAAAVEPIQHQKAPLLLFNIDLRSIKVAADLCLP